MKRILMVLFLIGLFCLLSVSCGRRENPVRPSYPAREVWQVGRNFTSLQGNAMQDPSPRTVYVYIPPMYDPIKQQPMLNRQGYSVLYLLHDFGGDNTTFTGVYKVAQIADQLIAEGQIQPMIIIMPDASSLHLGGSFYTNSSLMGNYEDYMVKEIMGLVDSSVHTYGDLVEGKFIPDKRYRAISGLGMGGYGALKIAMDYDTLFTSVSVMNPFTSFESFLSQETIEKVFEENGISASDFSYSSYRKLNPWSDSAHPDKTYSQIIFAMAAAFSPNVHNLSDPDTTSFFTLTPVLLGKKNGADLPFDSSRTIIPGSPIWNKWLLNDLKNKLNNDHTAFGDQNIYMDCGDQNGFKLFEESQIFDQLLSLYGKNHTYIEYSGYPGLPANQDGFIYDRLVEILKFHSQHFPPPAYRQ